MARLHALKNLSGISQTVLIAALLFFVQGGVTAAYAEGGAPANFQNYINTINGLLSGKISLTDLSSQAASSTSSASSTTFSLTSSLTTSSSTSSQNYTILPQTSCPSCYNASEHTAELLLPVSFSSLPEKESLLPAAESYSVIVCLSYNDTAAPDCREKSTPFQAGEKLASVIIKKYAGSAAVRPFRVVMPSSMPSDRQIQVLRQIETGAIDIIESVMLKNSNKENRNMFAEEIRMARQEAESGANWSPGLKNDKSTYSFHIGKALVSVNKIIISSRQFK